MNLEDLNNSQMILLVLLISLVVGFASAITAFALFLERDSSPKNGTGQTVIQQTINRIIERAVPVESDSSKVVFQQGIPKTYLEALEKSVVFIFDGGTLEATGVLVSRDGYVISSEPLRFNRRYTITLDGGERGYVTTSAEDGKNWLKPIDPIQIEYFISVLNKDKLTVGIPVTVLGVDELRRTASQGIVSEISKTGASLFKIAPHFTGAKLPSIIFSQDTVLGFLLHRDSNKWITVLESPINK